MMRRVFVWVHRYVGLAMALFLIVVGATGAILAFKDDVERLIAPQLYADPPHPAARRLDPATLAEKIESHEPKIRLAYFFAYPNQIVAFVAPRTDPATGVPYVLDFSQMFVDPWTGAELGRRRYGDLSQGRVNIVPFIYELHESLALGVLGAYTLGVVALAWTIDAFYALYLTLPRSTAFSWSRWKPSWLVKWRGGAFRLNFDLHRASGLWFWPLVLIFGWSSLMWNLPQVYSPVMSALFEVENEYAGLLDQPKDHPRLTWREAQRVAEEAMSERASKEGFTLGEPGMFGYLPEVGAFTYGVQTSLDVQRRAWNTGVWIDGDTGAVIKSFRPSGEHTGNTITWWLRALHFADLYGWISYRLLVCAFGLVIVMLSVTGVYIWWKKRRARLAQLQRASTATA